MKQLRLNRFHVGIAGMVLVIGVALIYVFAFYKPMKAKLDDTNTKAQANEDFVNQTEPKAKADLAAAKAQEAVVTASFDNIMKTRMPNIDLSDPIADMFRLWKFPQEEGVVIDNWFKNSGAQVTGYSFPAFPSTPADPTIKVLPPLSWTLSIQVKDFPSLLRWLEKLPKAPRFMVMGDVTIVGPRDPGAPLLATIPVTLYEWTKAAENFPEQTAILPAAGGAGAPGAAGQGAGGMPGGPPAGVPTGPPGASGGRGARGG